jgi:hypothetical protein
MGKKIFVLGAVQFGLNYGVANLERKADSKAA